MKNIFKSLKYYTYILANKFKNFKKQNFKIKIKQCFSVLELGFMFVALSIVLAALVPVISRHIHHSASAVSSSNSKYKSTDCGENCTYCAVESGQTTCISCELNNESCLNEGKKLNYRTCKCEDTKCNYGEYFLNNACVACSDKTPYCADCNESDGICTKCETGYELENGSCEKSCTTGDCCAVKYGTGCITCNKTQCTACDTAKGYKLEDGVCKNDCEQQFGEGCASCDSTKCLSVINNSYYIDKNDGHSKKCSDYNSTWQECKYAKPVSYKIYYHNCPTNIQSEDTFPVASVEPVLQLYTCSGDNHLIAKYAYTVHSGDNGGTSPGIIYDLVCDVWNHTWDGRSSFGYGSITVVFNEAEQICKANPVQTVPSEKIFGQGMVNSYKSMIDTNP